MTGGGGNIGRGPRAAFLIGLALLLAGCSVANEGRFTLVNGSTRQIDSVRVEACDQVIEYDGLAARGEAHGAFRIRGDSGYHVTVTFASGETLCSDVGYVTTGFDFENVITVTDSAIEISGGPVSAGD